MPANEFQSTQQASNIHVTGTVVDENGEPVIGATVRVPNTKLATVTDVDGKFVLDTPRSSLQVSYIGYDTRNIKAGRNLKIQLKQTNTDLNEVVVIGYGTTKKKDLTGAISNIRAEKLEKELPRSVEDLLRSNASGLYVGMSTNVEGSSSLQVRGKNTLTAGSSPLLVVDGIIYNG